MITALPTGLLMMSLSEEYGICGAYISHTAFIFSRLLQQHLMCRMFFLLVGFSAQTRCAAEHALSAATPPVC